MMSQVPSRFPKTLALLFLCLGVLCESSHASAQDSAESGSSKSAQCLEAHRMAQELKQKSQFLEARQHLSVCSSDGCPGVIIEDCGKWMSDLEQVTPSMVFQVYLDEQEAPDAKIYVDDMLVEDKVTGVKVNPGAHKVVAQLGDLAPLEQTVTLPAGQPLRLVRFDFTSTPSSAPASLDERAARRPTPVAVYPLLGVGIVGLGMFGAFALVGNSKKGSLEDSCAPNCSDNDLSSMKTMYLIGDISAGVGVAALIAAGVVYFTRPKKTESGAPVAFSVDAGPRSFGLSALGRF